MSPSIYQHYPTETLERWMAACARANQHAEAETIRQIISTRAAREEAA
ncbi:hypothetical protein [Mesorhizobium sp. Pch-S]|nr:hypothetical protein [Mesorhizobium sp. Pch-S]